MAALDILLGDVAMASVPDAAAAKVFKLIIRFLNS
jgi:hypothetical protein